MLYGESAFLDRFAAASADRFQGVEFWFPYAFPEEVLADRLTSSGLQQVLFDLPAGDWDKGERGIACHPDRVAEFERGIETAISYARALGCTRLTCLAGIAPEQEEETKLWETLVRNLRYAADRLMHENIRLLIEPLNTRDTPGYFIDRADRAMRAIAQVGSDNLFLQYDLYHGHVMGDDLAETLKRHIDRIGHIQLADDPGRHEPGTGAIDYPPLLALLDDLGYAGWVGCEYRPAMTTAESLGWLRPYLTR